MWTLPLRCRGKRARRGHAAPPGKASERDAADELHRARLAVEGRDRVEERAKRIAGDLVALVAQVAPDDAEAPPAVPAGPDEARVVEREGVLREHEVRRHVHVDRGDSGRTNELGLVDLALVRGRALEREVARLAEEAQVPFVGARDARR